MLIEIQNLEKDKELIGNLLPKAKHCLEIGTIDNKRVLMIHSRCRKTKKYIFDCSCYVKINEEIEIKRGTIYFKNIPLMDRNQRMPV